MKTLAQQNREEQDYKEWLQASNQRAIDERLAEKGLELAKPFKRQAGVMDCPYCGEKIFISSRDKDVCCEECGHILREEQIAVI